MITTSTVLTLSLAKAFGVYMIAGGLSGLLARDRWEAILVNFREKAGLTYISDFHIAIRLGHGGGGPCAHRLPGTFAEMGGVFRSSGRR